MATESSSRSSLDALLAFAGIAFAFFGVTSNVLYLSGAMACIGVMLAQRPAQRRIGLAVVAFAALYFIAVFGYDIGKDMAVRDNALGAAEASAKGPADEG